jgi:glycosyltransferase involved in cell wall biosynthesis
VVRLQGSHLLFAHTLGWPLRPLNAWLERRTLQAADHVVGITQFAYDTTCRLLPDIKSKPYSIIPNPIDTEAFHPQRSVPIEDGLVMFVGTLTARKGIGELIAAWPAVVAACPWARLELVAKDGMDPSSGRSWSSLIQERLTGHLAQTYRWHGVIDHDLLPATMARASVCVFPSHMETQSIVVCEAMALGKPTIFSLTGPGPEVVEDGVSGLLVNPHRPHEIASAIVRLLQDPEERERLGMAARQRANERFALSKIVDRNERLYQSLIDTRHRQAAS